MPAVTNIAAYKFAALTDLKPLRERLTALCKDSNLRGTILLSTEGVNLFVAGARSDIDQLLAELRSIPGLESLPAKFSESDTQPFRPTIRSRTDTLTCPKDRQFIRQRFRSGRVAGDGEIGASLLRRIQRG